MTLSIRRFAGKGVSAMGRNGKQTGSRDDRSAERPDLIAIDDSDRSIPDRSASLILIKDRGRGRIRLTLRNGVVVGAMGSEPERFMGLSESSARHLARYGALPTTPPTDTIPAVLYSLLGGKYRVRLDDPSAAPGHRSGAVLDDRGNVIGDASDYIYGGRGFSVQTKPFGGYVPSDQIVFDHEIEGAQ